MWSIFVDGKEYSMVYRSTRKSIVNLWISDVKSKLFGASVTIERI